MTERFDGAAVWSTLSLQQQSEIGALALEQIVASLCGADAAQDWPVPTPRAVAAAAAVVRLEDLVLEAFVQVIPHQLVRLESGATRLPSRLGPVCRACGCSNGHACPGGCEWVAEDLCSACADRGVR